MKKSLTSGKKFIILQVKLPDSFAYDLIILDVFIHMWINAKLESTVMPGDYSVSVRFLR